MKGSPILNSPYLEPQQHFGSDDRGLTDEIVGARRPSSTYIPVPRAKTAQKQAEQNTAEGAFGKELQRENDFVNKVRAKVGEWRSQSYPGVTKTTRDLLAYWQEGANNDRR
jgi:type III restriction enzyme